MIKILDGKVAAANLKQESANQIAKFIKNKIKPCLAIIWDDENQANNTYVRQKTKLCDELGITTKLIALNTIPTQKLLLNKIDELNKDPTVHGILVQLPLSKNINEETVLSTVSYKKDVDCFNQKNIGILWTAKINGNFIKPCTPEGIIQLLKMNNIVMESKNVVIVNRSNIVGKPLAALFLLENATVTICHSRTKDLKSICKHADILVCGIGKTAFFDHTYIKKDAVVIDVSMNRNSENKLCGDIDTNNLGDFEGWLSPVPGGVGPMTVAIVIKNLIKLIELENK